MIMNTKNAADYGFLPGASADENSAALNRAVENGGKIEVTVPGVYDISEPIYLGSDTFLTFGPGVTLRRMPCKNGDNGNAFVNRGAFSGVSDRNIGISGLTLSVNDTECLRQELGGTKTVIGLRGHLAFLYVENLTLSGITIRDLCKIDYAISICEFRHALVENCRLEGDKDGVHFGPGTDFAVRDCVFRTADDAIALNCSDYAPSNPTLGTIENGLIENCLDLPDTPTSSMFLRILVGGWKHWEKGMRVFHSDAVIHNGKLYRVVMRPDNESYLSLTPPTHETGFAEYDGIRWVRTHLGYAPDALPMTANCRNVTVKSCTILRSRPRQVLIYASNDAWLHSFHPGCPMPEVKDLRFENIRILAETAHFIKIETKTENVSVIRCSLGSSDIVETPNPVMPPYPKARIRFEP